MIFPVSRNTLRCAASSLADALLILYYLVVFHLALFVFMAVDFVSFGLASALLSDF